MLCFSIWHSCGGMRIIQIMQTMIRLTLAGLLGAVVWANLSGLMGWQAYRLPQLGFVSLAVILLFVSYGPGWKKMG
jgi:hypothetical protein